MMLFHPNQSWSETVNLETVRECVCVGINISRLYTQTMLKLFSLNVDGIQVYTKVSLCFVIVIKVV